MAFMQFIFGMPWCTLQLFAPQNFAMCSMGTLDYFFQITFKLIGFCILRQISNLHHQSLALLKGEVFNSYVRNHIAELGIGLCRNSHHFRKFSHFYSTLFNHFSSLHHTLPRNSTLHLYIATLYHASTLHLYLALLPCTSMSHFYATRMSHCHCLVSLHVTSQVLRPSWAARLTTPDL
jgi:hypothetical protein